MMQPSRSDSVQGLSTRSDRTASVPPSKTEPDSRSKRRSAKPAEARVAREAVAERQFRDSDLASSVVETDVLRHPAFC